MIRFVLFDLDGTLLSTLDTITYHLNGALKKQSLGEITVDETARFIGNGARKLVSRALAKFGVTDEEIIHQTLLCYNNAYDSDPLPETYAYEGITALVEALYERGVTLGVVTNKPEPTAKTLIEHFFPDRFVFVSGGREGAVLKPDPSESLSLLSKIGADVSECAFVGDTYVDIETGKNMNAALSIGVSWGFRSREELLGAGADAVVDHPLEILALIDGVI